MAEMGDYSTPFSTSPPYVQLMMLVFFNTAIFMGSALVQKAFSVDILPVVATMTGAGPLEPILPNTKNSSTSSSSSTPKQNPFEAFTRNFQKK